MQGAPLAQDFRIGTRIHDLVRRHAGQRIAGDVADAVAAGLDAVHVHVGQQVHHVGRGRQRDPVVLQVLTRGEVAVAAVMHAGDVGQLTQLATGQRAIRHGHPQHGRVALHIPAVLQAQRAELVVGQRAGDIALQLVAELRGAGADELAVEVGVGVHRNQVRTFQPAVKREMQSRARTAPSGNLRVS